jgi:hypothetical protein
MFGAVTAGVELVRLLPVGAESAVTLLWFKAHQEIRFV